jgi:two-component system, NarL family, sensor kinase
MTTAAEAPRRGRDVRRTLVAFVGVAVLVLLLISVAVILVARTVAQQEALRDAENTTVRLGRLVIAPLLGDALAGNAERRDELDRAVRIRLGDGSIAEVTVWRGDGTVLYADRADKIGGRYELTDELRDTIELRMVSSDIGIADETGNLPPGVRVVEVYVPLDVPGQPPLAFEAYYAIAPVDARAATLATQLIVLALVPLVVLQLVQIPIALSLARRIGRQEAERAALLARTLSASDRERRTIASDLHDGVVQELAGVGYALGALVSSVPPERRPIADSCAATVRGAVDGLRRLMIDIYPPDLSGPGLVGAIDQLAQPLRDAGVEVTVDAEALPAMEPDSAAAVYRVARESLANIAEHAQAKRVGVELGAVTDPQEAVRLRITDDGVGIEDGATDRREDGHFGLRMLADRAVDLGGRYTITARPEGGTLSEAVIPTHPG